MEVILTYGKLLSLSVKNDGIGIHANGIVDRVSGHYGIDGMRERVAQRGGSLSVVSIPENGTEVVLSARMKTKSSGASHRL